jgi:hypothetical protein
MVGQSDFEPIITPTNGLLGDLLGWSAGTLFVMALLCLSQLRLNAI